MAEFSVVMKQAKRMCLAHWKCTDCPLGDECKWRKIDFGYTAPNVWKLDEIAACADIVMSWAAEHPEPKYPSWDDGWKQLFPYGNRAPCPTAFGGEYAPERCGSNFCKICKARPIPAEIAEKLNIKPIGG